MKPRVALLPGFGEDTSCFRGIRPALSDYEIIDVDYRPVLAKFNFLNLNVYSFVKALVKHYGIQPQDILLGHSMGGYFSSAIMNLYGNEVAALCSFSDPHKIIRATENVPLSYFTAISGLLQSKPMRDYFHNTCKGKAWEEEMMRVVDNFKTFTPVELTKMMKMSYGEKLKFKNKIPLRIHAKNDRVVRPPDEPYEEVGGGHFSMILDSQNVLKKLSVMMELKPMEV